MGNNQIKLNNANATNNEMHSVEEESDKQDMELGKNKKKRLIDSLIGRQT